VIFGIGAFGLSHYAGGNIGSSLDAARPWFEICPAVNSWQGIEKCTGTWDEIDKNETAWGATHKPSSGINRCEDK